MQTSDSALAKLKDEYAADIALYQRFASAITSEILELFKQTAVTLGVPIESRVKSWSSIEEKIKRLDLQIRSVRDVHDLIGVRSIFLFTRDQVVAIKQIEHAFEVESQENAADRLGDRVFGYHSIHLIVRPRAEWLSLPSMRQCEELRVELQLRTLAQHIWAAVSHKLQYKRENNIPVPIRRTIHRASALLETIDLEFERVLSERDEYVAGLDDSDEVTPLNVNVLERLLDQRLPVKNKEPEDEDYAQLLLDLHRNGIETTEDLEGLISAQLESALKKDRQAVAAIEVGDPHYQPGGERRQSDGVFFTHVGLVREMVARIRRKTKRGKRKK